MGRAASGKALGAERRQECDATYLCDRTSICVPRAASGWLSGMGESTKSPYGARAAVVHKGSGGPNLTALPVLPRDAMLITDLQTVMLFWRGSF